MIGKIPAVLKINRQVNRVSCFLFADFRRAIAFRTASRIAMTRIKIQNQSPSLFACIYDAIRSGVMFAVGKDKT